MINPFTLLLPVFGIIAFGYLLSKCNITKPNWVKKLNNFVYYISLPALILILFWQIEFSQSTLNFFGFHIGFILIISLLLIISFSFFAISKKTKVTMTLGVIMGNTLYMGYPILRSTFPDFPIEISMGAGTIQLISAILVGIILVEYIIKKTENFSTYIIDLAKNPLIIAVILGIFLSFIPHNQTSETIFKLISLIGESASPLALFTLGIFMNRKFSSHNWSLSGLVMLIKLILLPIIILLLSIGLGFSKEFIQVSVLISAMPTAITSFVLAQKYNLDEQLSADIIVVSTVLSIASLPLVAWLIN